MILLRSVLFLLCVIICCQESVSTAVTSDTKQHQTDEQHQEPPIPTNKPEDSPKKDEAEKLDQSDGTPDEKQLAARRRQCCDNGRQHFYVNGNCNNISKEELEAVGPFCEQKFMQCCLFMKSYYMRTDDVSPCQHRHNQKINLEESSTKDVSSGDGHESKHKPNGTSDDWQFVARRRKCCDDGRQHFYVNGNCNNRSQEELEAVGPWCDHKFVECCQFMVSYYMRKHEVSPCQSKLCQKTNPEESPKKEDSHECKPKPDAIPDDQELAVKKRKCCDDGRQHFYTNGNCNNRSKETLEAVGPWCDLKFVECCQFMELYYNRKHEVSPCQSKPCQKTDPQESPKKDEDQPKPDDSPKNDEAPKPDATPDKQKVAVSRRQCCDDGRQHFYSNGNCANRPQEKNEAVGPWCDSRFLQCCLFMESYYLGPEGGSPCQNKKQVSTTPSPTDASSVAKEGQNQ